MTNEPLPKLWIITGEGFTYGEFQEAVVWARTEKRARNAVIEEFFPPDRRELKEGQKLNVEEAPTTGIVSSVYYPG